MNAVAAGVEKKFKCKVCGRKFEATWQVAQHARKKHPKDKDKLLTTPEEGSDNGFVQDHTIFAFSHVQTWLDIYAGSSGIPSTLLTDRVARLLLSSTRGQVLGSLNSMPTLRGKTAKRPKVL